MLPGPGHEVRKAAHGDSGSAAPCDRFFAEGASLPAELDEEIRKKLQHLHMSARKGAGNSRSGFCIPF